MNEIVNTFLLAGDKFMPRRHLKQLGFTCDACGSFTKNYADKKSDFIYKNGLDKACFQHDVAYGKYKDLNTRTQSGKVLRHEAFEIPSNPKYDGYHRGLASTVYRFFEKKSTGSDVSFMPNQQLANEPHKPIISKFKIRKVYSSYKGNIWAVDLADMQLVSKYNKGIMYLLCAIETFSNNAWVVPTKDEKVPLVNAFPKILDS